MVKAFLTDVKCWPANIRRVWLSRTDALMERYRVPEDDAQLRAYCDVVLGRVKLPGIKIRMADADRVPACVAGLPTEIEWVN